MIEHITETITLFMVPQEVRCHCSIIDTTPAIYEVGSFRQVPQVT